MTIALTWAGQDIAADYDRRGLITGEPATARRAAHRSGAEGS
jgi:hypothetical protein